MIKGTKGSGGFVYASTRVRVMAGRLLQLEQYQKFLKMDVNEIARFLGETDYRTEMEELAVKYHGITLLEYALSRNLARTFDRVLGFTLPPTRYAILGYLQRWEVWNVKCLLRGRLSNSSEDEILETVVPLENLGYSRILKAVKGTRNFHEALDSLNGTAYYNTLKSLDGKGLVQAEDSLDRLYYARLFEVVGKRPDLLKYFRTEVDVKNVITLLRLKRAGFPSAEIPRHIIPGGATPYFAFGPLAGREFGEIVENFRHSPFWRYAPADNIDAKNFISRVETGLRKYLVSISRKFIHGRPSSLTPIIGYFVAKEAEVANIRIIVRGKQAGLPEKEIEQGVIVS